MEEILLKLHDVIFTLYTSKLHADSEDSDQTKRMPRLICLRWAYSYFVDFVVRRLIYALLVHLLV